MSNLKPTTTESRLSETVEAETVDVDLNMTEDDSEKNVRVDVQQHSTDEDTESEKKVLEGGKPVATGKKRKEKKLPSFFSHLEGQFPLDQKAEQKVKSSDQKKEKRVKLKFPPREVIAKARYKTLSPYFIIFLLSKVLMFPISYELKVMCECCNCISLHNLRH